MKDWKNRVKRLDHVSAGSLIQKDNWRRHPPVQTAALRGLLDEVGFAGALIAFEREDGELQLIDGHLRLSLAKADDLMPVLVLDVNEEEAKKLMLAYDPISALSVPDPEALDKLLAEVKTNSEALESLFRTLKTSAGEIEDLIRPREYLRPDGTHSDPELGNPANAFPPSRTRMVSLFFTEEQYATFFKEVERLKVIFGVETVTDVVLWAVIGSE